ncbi:MAG: hypothetical protein KBS89_00860 [Bacteroidales bacterium]|nr:hypothetical protein [Candidatus Egerieousia equi]
MANLIIPDKNKHKYVVGIDYGHGETSAAICSIEWEKDAGLRETKVLDIDLDRAARKKVITSAISHVTKGILIGDEAFEHMTDNNGIRVCFKQKPESIDGDAERLMIDFMKAVYCRIRESQEELTDTNHIVYIARPSGWVEEEAKELYRQMAIQAGIPLGGLTSESRAAIFYAKSPSVNFAKEISKGAIVFDLGSSTLDFTYLSDAEKPIDYGYNLGASIIDNAIFENMILKDNDVKEFVGKYPEYRDALQFKGRKFKEDAYGRNEDSKTIGGFPLGIIISDTEDSYDDYADCYVKLRIANLGELNDMVNSTTHYMDELKKALEDYKTTKIPGKTVNGVFLTGGASRMNFIRPIISEAFNLPLDKVKIDNDNPSLTISRGIALLGATDATTTILVSELKKSLPSMISNDKMLSSLVDFLAKNITEKAWNAVDKACSSWVKTGHTTNEDELKQKLEIEFKSFQTDEVPDIINRTIQSFLKEGSEDVRKKMNEIISRYAPGREISLSGSVKIGDVQPINDSVSEMFATISKICDSITKVVLDGVLEILSCLLLCFISEPWALSKEFDIIKRKVKADNILDKKYEVTCKVESKLRKELAKNTVFKNSVTSSLSNYFTKLIESNLQQVMIPIE